MTNFRLQSGKIFNKIMIELISSSRKTIIFIRIINCLNTRYSQEYSNYTRNE